MPTVIYCFDCSQTAHCSGICTALRGTSHATATFLFPRECGGPETKPSSDATDTWTEDWKVQFDRAIGPSKPPECGWRFGGPPRIWRFRHSKPRTPKD